jgi:hypothetical protein
VARLALPILALALGVAVAVGMVSCGGRDEKGLLPGENAQQIVDNLNQVEQDTANGDCELALQHAKAVQTQIGELGNDVNAQLKQRLADGAAKLEQLIPTDCVEAAPPPVEPTTSTTTDEETTDKQNTKSTTTSTTTTSTTTTPTTPTGPPTGGTPGAGGGVLPPDQSGIPDQSGNGQGSG